jgi:hypothetical protein
MEFDIAQLLENEDQHQMFSLTGIVNHSGTAMGGHYTSCVKINGKWFKFDDINVTEIPESAVMDDSLFGLDYRMIFSLDDHTPSAYLLFYAKSDLAIPESDEKLTDPSDAQLVATIEVESRTNMELQAVFSPAILHLMMHETNLDLLLLYLFNVFAHSAHTADARPFAFHILDVIETQQANSKVFKFFNSKIADIEAIYVKANSEEISSVFGAIISYLIQNGPEDQAILFISRLFDDLETHATNWRVLGYFLAMIVNFQMRYPLWAADNQWISRFVNFIKHTLESNKSTVFAQNFNAASFFMFLTDNLELASSSDIDTLCSVAGHILQSQIQSDVFMRLMLKASEKQMVQMSTFVDTIISHVKDPSSSYVVTIFVQVATTEEILIKFLSSPRISKEALLLSLSRDLENLAIRQRLLDVETKVLFHLLTIGNSSTNELAVRVVRSLFPKTLLFHSLTPVEDILNPALTPVKFSWKEPESLLSVDPEDVRLLNLIIQSFVNGIKQINDDPTPYLNGKQANVVLAPFIRTLFWVSDRIHPDFSVAQIETILDLFETLDRAKIPDDGNQFELVRVICALGPPAIAPISVRLPRLLDIVFGVVYENSPILRQYIFAEFCDSFTPVFEAHPELFQTAITHPGFSESFRQTALSSIYRPLGSFFRLVSALQLNVSSFLRPHWAAMLVSPSMSAIQVIEKCPGFSPTDSDFTTLIIQILSSSCPINRQRPSWALKKSYRTLTAIAASHSITDLDAIKACVSDVFAVYSRRRLTEPVSGLLAAIAARSPELHAYLSSKISAAASPHVAALRLSLALHNLETAAARSAAVLTVISAYPSEYDSETGSLPPVLTDLLVRDGFDVHREWAVLLFAKVVQSPGTPEADGKFMEICMASMTADALLALLTALVEQFADDRSAVVMIGARFAQGRPDLKERVMDLLGVGTAIPSEIWTYLLRVHSR